MPIIYPPASPKVAQKAAPFSETTAIGALAPWHHPYLDHRPELHGELSREQLVTFAYDFHQRFLPFFSHQKEGSLGREVRIEFTLRMRQKLGLAYLFERKIRLNQLYFAQKPALLPYALFHELTHLWLYDCLLDPGHTHRFYKKMAEFDATGLPIDEELYVHTRVSPEGQHVYICPNCKNRWYLRERLQKPIYCGHCFDREGVEYYARPLKITARQDESASASDSSAA